VVAWHSGRDDDALKSSTFQSWAKLVIYRKLVKQLDLFKEMVFFFSMSAIYNMSVTGDLRVV
jgi:hypothetical protein